MCLSPEVDIVAGTLIGFVAIETLRSTQASRMRPIASIPAIFAIHSFSSAFIWLAVQGHVSQTVGDIATAIYAVIAFVLLPIVVPLSVLAITSHSRRRQMMIVLSVAGVIAGIDFAINMIHGNTNVLACHYYLDVRVTSTLAITSTLYGVATCAVMLLSEYRPLRLWGVVNVIAVAFLYIRLENGLASIWCLWAALTSFFVLWMVKELNRQHEEVGKWAWELDSQGK